MKTFVIGIKGTVLALDPNTGAEIGGRNSEAWTSSTWPWMESNEPVRSHSSEPSQPNQRYLKFNHRGWARIGRGWEKVLPCCRVDSRQHGSVRNVGQTADVSFTEANKVNEENTFRSLPGVAMGLCGVSGRRRLFLEKVPGSSFSDTLLFKTTLLPSWQQP
jgi:hypothetical protein